MVGHEWSLKKNIEARQALDCTGRNKTVQIQRLIWNPKEQDRNKEELGKVSVENLFPFVLCTPGCFDNDVQCKGQTFSLVSVYIYKQYYNKDLCYLFCVEKIMLADYCFFPCVMGHT